jgi:hypothetical protein
MGIVSAWKHETCPPITTTYAAEEGIKATEKEIQESMGDMLLVESRILPLEMKIHAIARDTALNQLFRKLFSLPEPQMFIEVLNEAETSQIDIYIHKWHETWIEKHHAPP